MGNIDINILCLYNTRMVLIKKKKKLKYIVDPSSLLSKQYWSLEFEMSTIIP